jgi:hypothetical protein
MAAAGRRELRDIVNPLGPSTKRFLPLRTVIWAAGEKAPGFIPEGLIAEIRRNSHYPSIEWTKLLCSQPIDPKIIMEQLRAALDEADTFVVKMQTDKAGLLFLQTGQVVGPESSRLESYQAHAGRRRGHWPSNLGITSAMRERYTKRPNPQLPASRAECRPCGAGNRAPVRHLTRYFWRRKLKETGSAPIEPLMRRV